MPKVYLSLGSNIGDRRQYLKAAIKLLTEHPALRLSRCSGVYQTEPVGTTIRQEVFWNLCLKLEVDETQFTTGAAEVLLQYCLSCEQKLGRNRQDQRWAPRTIDIDLIDYGLSSCKKDFLTLPHPRFLERLFVLVPLLEIADDQLRNKYLIAERIQDLESRERSWGHKVLNCLS